MKVEFIESYIHDEKGGDYVWNDNHGELIRCKDCKYYKRSMYHCPYLFKNPVMDDDYCSLAVRREE